VLGENFFFAKLSLSSSSSWAEFSFIFIVPQISSCRSSR
jgi:hypothetical protein